MCPDDDDDDGGGLVMITKQAEYKRRGKRHSPC